MNLNDLKAYGNKEKQKYQRTFNAYKQAVSQNEKVSRQSTDAIRKAYSFDYDTSRGQAEMSKFVKDSIKGTKAYKALSSNLKAVGDKAESGLRKMATSDYLKNVDILDAGGGTGGFMPGTSSGSNYNQIMAARALNNSGKPLNSAQKQYIEDAQKAINADHEMGVRGRTAMLKNPFYRGVLGATEGLASSLSMGATDSGGNAIESWQREREANLTEDEAKNYANSTSYNVGRMGGELAGMMAQYGLAKPAFEKISKKTGLTNKLEKSLNNDASYIGKTKLEAKSAANDWARAERLRSGKDITAEAKKIKEIGLRNRAVSERASDIGSELLADATLGNIQDIASANARGEDYTLNDALLNNAMNLLGTGTLDYLGKSIKGIDKTDFNLQRANNIRRGMDEAKASKKASKTVIKETEKGAKLTDTRKEMQALWQALKKQGMSNAEATRETVSKWNKAYKPSTAADINNSKAAQDEIVKIISNAYKAGSANTPSANTLTPKTIDTDVKIEGMPELISKKVDAESSKNAVPDVINKVDTDSTNVGLPKADAVYTGKDNSEFISKLRASESKYGDNFNAYLTEYAKKNKLNEEELKSRYALAKSTWLNEKNVNLDDKLKTFLDGVGSDKTPLNIKDVMKAKKNAETLDMVERINKATSYEELLNATPAKSKISSAQMKSNPHFNAWMKENKHTAENAERVKQLYTSYRVELKKAVEEERVLKQAEREIEISKKAATQRISALNKQISKLPDAKTAKISDIKENKGLNTYLKKRGITDEVLKLQAENELGLNTRLAKFKNIRKDDINNKIDKIRRAALEDYKASLEQEIREQELIEKFGVSQGTEFRGIDSNVPLEKNDAGIITAPKEAPDKKASKKRGERNNADLNASDELLNDLNNGFFTMSKTVKEAKKLDGEKESALSVIKRKFIDKADPFYQYDKKHGTDTYKEIGNIINQKATINNAISGSGIYREINGKTVQVSESLNAILNPIRKNEKDYEDLNRYLYDRLNLSRDEQGKSVWGYDGETARVSAEESRKRMDEIEKSHKNDELFWDTIEKVDNFVEQTKQIRLDAGIFSEGLLGRWAEETPNYIPTHRLGEGERVAPKRVSGARGLDAKGTKTGRWKNVHGSSKPLLPLHEQLSAELQRSVEQANMNNLAIKIFDSEYGGDLLKVIKSRNGRDIDNEIMEEIENGNLFKLGGLNHDEETNKYTLSFVADGERYTMEIPKDLAKSLEDVLTPTTQLKVLNKANRIFRNLVTTWNPAFALVNGMRDFGDALLFTKYGTAKFLKNYGRAWKGIITNSNEYRLYKSLIGSDANLFKSIEDVGKANWLRKNVLQRVEEVNEAVESAARFSEFLSGIEKYGTSREGLLKAAADARDVSVDFSRGGRIVQTMNANGATFLNAGVQDLVRLERAIKEGRWKQLIVGASMFGIAPSIINELVYADDEDYQNLMQSNKDENYFIKIPGTQKFVKIPKGRVASVFGIIPQRTARLAEGNARLGDAYKGVGKTIVSQIAPANPVTNNLAAPIFQTMYGKTWYGTDIVNSSLSKLPNGEQTDEYTSTLATKLGAKLGLSPKKIDYVIKQYSGVIGQYLLPALTPSKQASGKALSTFTDRFITDSVSSNGLQSTFYEEYDAANKKNNSSNATVEDGAYYQYLDSARQGVSEYSKQIRETINSSASNKEKQQKILDIQRERNDFINNVLDSADAVKKNIDWAKDTLNPSNYKSDNAYNKAVAYQALAKSDRADAGLKAMDSEAYKTVKSTGWSAEGYLKAKALTSGNTNKTLKAYAAAKNGATYAQAMSLDDSLTQKTYNRGKALANSGLSDAQIMQVANSKSYIDANGNGRYSKSEVVDYLNNSTVFTRSQKRAMFSYLMPNAKNPY